MTLQPGVGEQPSQQQSNLKLNRRQFLRAASLVGGAATIGGVAIAVAGCVPNTEPTKPAVSTPEKAIVPDVKNYYVNQVLRGDIRGAFESALIESLKADRTDALDIQTICSEIKAMGDYPSIDRHGWAVVTTTDNQLMIFQGMPNVLRYLDDHHHIDNPDYLYITSDPLRRVQSKFPDQKTLAQAVAEFIGEGRQARIIRRNENDYLTYDWATEKEKIVADEATRGIYAAIVGQGN